MITHAFKIITNQWRKNVWITIELFIVLAVLWFTVDFFSVLWLTSRTSTGFDIKDTYIVNFTLTSDKAPGYIAYEPGSEEPGRNFLRLVERLRTNPNIETVCMGIYYYPYCLSTSGTTVYHDSLQSNANILQTTPEYFDVFRVQSKYGDTREQLKASLNDGYIISGTIENKLFPGNSAKGQYVYEMYQGDTTDVYRISNVVTTMKQYEFGRPISYIYFPFMESELMNMDEESIWQSVSICVRTRPGSHPKEMVAKLNEELKGNFEAGNFSLAAVRPVSTLRENYLWRYGVYETLNYTTFFTVFFLANVFLGILGTFWLRINKRREEIGIRMALGSSRRRLLSQMLIESFVLVLIAAIPAALVWLNIVVAELLPTNRYDVTASRLVLNTVFALGLTILATTLATWYPARKAASMPAAEALRYE